MSSLLYVVHGYSSRAANPFAVGDFIIDADTFCEIMQ